MTREFLSLRLHTIYLKQAAEAVIQISRLIQESTVLSEGLNGTKIKRETEVE